MAAICHEIIILANSHSVSPLTRRTSCLTRQTVWEWKQDPWYWSRLCFPMLGVGGDGMFDCLSRPSYFWGKAREGDHLSWNLENKIHVNLHRVLFRTHGQDGRRRRWGLWEFWAALLKAGSRLLSPEMVVSRKIIWLGSGRASLDPQGLCYRCLIA